MKKDALFLVACAIAAAPAAPASGGEPVARLRMKVSWGHKAPEVGSRFVRLVPDGVEISGAAGVGLEPGDEFRDGAWRTAAGAGDVDGVEFTLAFPEREVKVLEKPHVIWSYLIEHSDPEAARRLRQDPGFRIDPRRLTFQMDAGGTRGFTLTADQILGQRRFWVPALDAYISAGEPPAPFEEHERELEAWAGQRILDRVRREPEASYEKFTSLWEDLGSPGYRNPAQAGPGHIVCLAWDSSLPKFGVDRGAGVWNDYGNPDRFRLRFDFGDLSRDLTRSWKGQKLERGLPVIATTFEEDGVRCEVEQFAFPLEGPPPERRGDIRMVLFGKLRLKDLEGRPRKIALGMTHQRELKEGAAIVQRRAGAAEVLEEASSRRALLAIRGDGLALASRMEEGSRPMSVALTASLDLAPGGARELFIQLPSPPVEPGDLEKLLRLEHAVAREATLRFWSERLAEGASFDVPEEVVNDLFRANLWHALRLAGRRGGSGPGVAIDLPYSNFAYDQAGTPWPVNQCVYVDTMIYDLRGYHAISAEEISAIFRNNQEESGRVKGFASWGVYTPSMIYSAALHFLLSGDRGSFERLLPQSLKALDWCLGEMEKAAREPGPASGLIRAPLNDLSHENRAWAFNQAYFSAGIKLLGQALARIGHPRAKECLDAARAFDRSIERGFGHASMLSPLVQLRDRTWSPYVPGDALTPRRLFEVWYPTDVDSGPLHLPRLKALDPNGFLTTCLLEDHEDNLFLRGLGMANEPVYNQQATVYLLRDEPEAAIRAFYSMMACAFSHSVLEPVEHRWAWGQYFGPPSTDGAWFDLYRRMLIHERDDGSLLLLQAAPRKWLEDGKKIRVERAPTWYGKLSLAVESRAGSGEILAAVDLPARVRPSCLLLRLRHPRGQALRSVSVNGGAWTDFDAGREWIRVPGPDRERYEIVARY